MAIQQPNLRKRHRKIELPTGSAEVWLQKDGLRIALHRQRPNGGGSGSWDNCKEQGCLGNSVINNSVCLLHATEPEVRTHLNLLVDNGKRLSIKGVEVTQELIDLIFTSDIIQNGKVLIPLEFIGAELLGTISFQDITFTKWVNFNGSIIRNPFSFENCKFEEDFVASFVFFNAGPPHFKSVSFQKRSEFSYSHAERVSIGFTESNFENTLLLEGVSGPIIITDCYFANDLNISNARGNGIRLSDSEIIGSLNLMNSHFSTFDAPKLITHNTQSLGPVTIDNYLNLDRGQFERRVEIEATAKTLFLKGTRLVEGGQISVESDDINLDQVSSGMPLRIFSTSRAVLPIVVSFRDADVGNMTFSKLNLSLCIFRDAREINKVRIEPSAEFFEPPTRMFVKRKCIADEYAVRIHSGKYFASLWEKAWETNFRLIRKDVEPTKLPKLDALQVASVYRDLRYSFEAKNDLMGAADFYYGEMEMRRHSQHAPYLERTILFLYWLISGYGLTASRSIFWLIVLILGGAYLMVLFGFDQNTSATFENGLLFAFKSIVPGVSSGEKLTNPGEWIEIILAVLGPSVAAFGILALRERIKR